MMVNYSKSGAGMKDAASFLATVNKSGFTKDGFVKRTDKPWGYELYLIGDDERYMFKIMHINEGCRQSLQAHDSKTETWLVIKGRAAVLIELPDGTMVQEELKPETGYTTKIGQRHRLIGLTDCDIAEASTPEDGTTWRLEDDYARPDETEEVRADPNRGWNG
jgi:mannose-6-phosphate isomerase